MTSKIKVTQHTFYLPNQTAFTQTSTSTATVYDVVESAICKSERKRKINQRLLIAIIMQKLDDAGMLTAKDFDQIFGIGQFDIEDL